MVKRIIQKDTWSCFACVAAMITGKTVEEVYSFVGHDGSGFEDDSTHPEKRVGFGTLEIIKYLAECGYSIGTWSVFEDGTDISGFTEIHFELKLEDCPAIVEVKAARLGDKCSHVIYWDGKTVFDPSPTIGDNPGFSPYKVLKYMPVLYYNNK